MASNTKVTIFGLLILLHSWFLPSLSFGDEGFFSSPPMQTPLLSGWNNTVLILGPQRADGLTGSGSGVILREQMVGNKLYLYILTAGHLAADLNWPAGVAVGQLNQKLLEPKVLITSQSLYKRGLTDISPSKITD